jgi:hypothetical protein
VDGLPDSGDMELQRSSSRRGLNVLTIDDDVGEIDWVSTEKLPLSKLRFVL